MPVPCPFVYANGKRCTGRIVRVEAYKADIEWSEDDKGQWCFDWRPGSHYHLFCSEHGNHAGWKRQDDSRMKLFFDELPDGLRALILSTRPAEAENLPRTR